MFLLLHILPISNVTNEKLLFSALKIGCQMCNGPKPHKLSACIGVHTFQRFSMPEIAVYTYINMSTFILFQPESVSYKK